MKKLEGIICASSVLTLFVILTVFSSRAAECARESLRVCAFSVIPSLFPFMVVSNLIVSSGAVLPLGRILPIGRLYSLPAHSSPVILLGALCGFPVGAKAAAELYRRGELTKDEAEVLISVSNNTGPSFVVFVIGSAFWKSTRFGWLLYAFQLLSSLLAGIIINRLVFPFKQSSKKSPEVKLCRPDFFLSVSDSASSVVTVTGFIVFFSVVTGLLLPVLSKVSPILSCTAAALTEFTGGCRLSAALGGYTGRFLCGLSVGWSGLSVFCQTAAFCSPLGLSLKRTVAKKALQGVFTGLLCAFLAGGCDLSYADGSLPLLYSNASVLLSSPVPTAIISSFIYIFLIKKLAKDYKI